MAELFFESFNVTLGAVGRIFLIIVVSGILVRKNVITQDQVKAMSKVTVNILLPCMLFAKFSQNFDPYNTHQWYLIPLSSIAMIMIGIAFGYLFFIRKSREKQFLFPTASMQNAIYLILPMGKFLYPDQFDEFTVYNFLYLIGFMPLVWSIGKVLITGASLKEVSYKEFLTPPLIAAMSTLFLVFTGLVKFIPSMLLDSAELVGSATIPVSNVVLGATLGSISLKKFIPFWDLLRLSAIKFMIIPILTLTVLHLIGLRESNPLLANMLVLESAAAPATALILQIRAFGGDQQSVGSTMLLFYIICLFAIPFWTAIWNIL